MMWSWLAFGVARAQNVTVDIDAAKAQALGLDPADLENQLQGLIADELYTDDNDWYMAKYANASAMAVKGMGVDYASNFKTFVVGGSLGPAVSGVPFSLTRGPDALPEGGFALMAAGHAGVNLGLLDGGKKTPLDHVRVFVSGLALNPPGNDQFQASMYNFGGHVQLSVGGPKKLTPVFTWGGLLLTAGYEQSSYRLSLSQTLPLSQKIEPATVTWRATGTYDLGATARTVPIELSTNFRVAVLTPYAGVGLDLDTADASSQVSLSGPISASAQGAKEDLGSASVTLDGFGSAAPLSPRVFGGAQVALAYFKLYGQLNYRFDQTYGAFIGARFAM